MGQAVSDSIGAWLDREGALDTRFLAGGIDDAAAGALLAPAVSAT